MPSLSVRSGGVWKTVKTPSVRSGGAWKALKNGYVRSGGAWKLFYSGAAALSVTATVSPGFCFGAGSCNAIASATATGHGGSGSYTYSWTRVSGSTGYTLVGGNTATPTWNEVHATGGAGNQLSDSAVYRCTVNDGTSTATVDVTINLTFVDNR